MSPDGNLIASDFATGGVYILNGTSMEGALGFMTVGEAPVAVAAGTAGIYVGNTKSQCVDLYNYDGTLKKKRLIPVGTIKKPADIALDEAAGKLFVLDSKEKMVKVYDLDGSPDTSFSAGLNMPTSMAIDTATQTVFISDYNEFKVSFSKGSPGKIATYDYAGNGGITILSPTSSGTYSFSRPQGLSVHPSGYILMTDVLLGRVFVFNSTTGAGVNRFGSMGTGDGELFSPLDVLLDPVTYYAYVADYSNGRITIFNSGEVIP
jgi:DNA-binding beta-propeller fold protein YncE